MSCLTQQQIVYTWLQKWRSDAAVQLLILCSRILLVSVKLSLAPWKQTGPCCSFFCAVSQSRLLPNKISAPPGLSLTTSQALAGAYSSTPVHHLNCCHQLCISIIIPDMSKLITKFVYWANFINGTVSVHRSQTSWVSLNASLFNILYINIYVGWMAMWWHCFMLYTMGLSAGQLEDKASVSGWLVCLIVAWSHECHWFYPFSYLPWNGSTNMCRACHLPNLQHEAHLLNMRGKEERYRNHQHTPKKKTENKLLYSCRFQTAALLHHM